jgi:hypothetical protein
VLAFADGAILFARAGFFRFVALVTSNRCGHEKSPKKLYLTTTRAARMLRAAVFLDATVLSQLRANIFLREALL